MSNINWKFWQDKFKLLVDRGDGATATGVFSAFWEERV